MPFSASEHRAAPHLKCREIALGRRFPLFWIASSSSRSLSDAPTRMLICYGPACDVPMVLIQQLVSWARTSKYAVHVAVKHSYSQE